MQDNEKVHYVINKTTGERVSKFYSKQGLAKNFIKKFPEHSREDFEAVTRFCVDSTEQFWIRIGKGFGHLLPRESQTLLKSPGVYDCSLVLEDPKTLNKFYLETTNVEVSNYHESKNSQVQ